MSSEKITSRQMILLITVFRITSTILYMPSLNFPPTNQDTWIVVLASYLYTILIGIPILFLVNKFNNFSFVENMEKIFGKIIGRIFGTLYGLYFMVIAIFLTTIQTKIIGINILAYTPNYMIIGILILVALYVGTKEFHVIVWGGEIVIPITLVTILGMIVLGLKNVDFTLLLPVLSDSTFYEINLGALMLSFIATDIFILAMSVQNIENKKDINKIYFKSKFYSTIIVTLIVLVTMGALGVEQARHTNFPFLIYTRLIKYESVFERIDPMYTISWLFANIGKILAYIYFSSMAFKVVIGKKNNKTINSVVSIIVGIIALYFSNTITIAGYTNIINLTLIFLSIAFTLVIPLISLTVYFFRRKTLNSDNNT